MSSANHTDPNKADLYSTVERRRNLRFPFTAMVEATETKTGMKIIGRTSDLSLGGCYVDTLSPFPVGTETKIWIQREKETFEAQAKVIYSSIGMGMGLAFISAQAKHVRLFQKWLLEISGQPVPGENAPSLDTSEPAPAGKTQTLKNVVLSDLIMKLMEKKVLTQGEGKDLLRKLCR